MEKKLFCVLCGQRHSFGVRCDPAYLAWINTRREEVANSVPYWEATPMPQQKSE